MENLLSFVPLVVLVLLVGLLVMWFRRRAHDKPPPILEAVDLDAVYVGPFAFFRRHYNGDYGLARSYWVNTVLVSFFAPLLGLLLAPWLAQNFPARYASAAILLTTALGVGLWVWAIAGTWASSKKHVQRGGASGWATAARVVIVLGVLRTAGELAQQSPMLSEHLKVAVGQQWGSATTVEVLPDGKTIRLSGGINDGAAASLGSALKLAPTVTTLVLNSEGGWVREGAMLAALVRERNLDTYVEDYCASACTIAFLAGANRAADPKARIGFHSVTYVGSTGALTREEAAATRAAYAAAQLPEGFVHQISQTPGDSMWYPTHAEMIQAKVFTRASYGGETAALASIVRSRDQLDREFQKLRVYQVMAGKFPQEYAAMLDAAWAKLAQGRTDAEVFDAARGRLWTLVEQHLPLAANDTLNDYRALIQAQLDYLLRLNPVACIELMYPTGHQSPASLLPAELTRRELELTRKVLEESDLGRRLRSSTQVQDAVDGLYERLDRTELLAMATAEGRAQDPAAACRGTRNVFAAVGQLPSPLREQVLRSIFTP